MEPLTANWVPVPGRQNLPEPSFLLKPNLTPFHSLDEAIADFSIAYADQSERDHEVLMKAVRAGKLEVFVEEQY
jgi:hypothetical protein